MKRSTGTACTMHIEPKHIMEIQELLPNHHCRGHVWPTNFFEVLFELYCIRNFLYDWWRIFLGVIIEQYFLFIFCLVFAARDLLKYIFKNFCQHFDLCKIFYGKLIGNFFLIRVNRQNSSFSKLAFLLTPKVKIPGPSCVMY